MAIFTFKMPDIGEGVVEGEVVAWLKKEGEAVHKDEPVLVLMTDKATVELPTPYAGVIRKLYYPVGAIAKKDLPLFDVEIQEEIREKEPVKEVISHDVKPVRQALEGKVLAAPPVRKMARELGISLQGIQGSGPAGRILREDLHTHQAHTPVLHLPGDTESPIVGIKNLMAQKMVESTSLIPHFSYFDQADATHLVHLKEKMLPEALQKGIKLTYMPFMLKALSLTLHKYPDANSSIDSEKNSQIKHECHNVGIAMTTPLGLIVPVLKRIEKLTLTEIIYAFEELKEKAKNNKLLPSDMKEGTVTITNFGALSKGGLFATPIINYPEVAILGIARIQKQPVAVNDTVTLRDILNCSWSFDHRVIDGDLAATISGYFTSLIENPAHLL